MASTAVITSAASGLATQSAEVMAKALEVSAAIATKPTRPEAVAMFTWATERLINSVEFEVRWNS